MPFALAGANIHNILEMKGSKKMLGMVKLLLHLITNFYRAHLLLGEAGASPFPAPWVKQELHHSQHLG